jgi:hypothetical protein
MTPKPCDKEFDRAEKAFRRAAENLLGAAKVSVRQAGHDLARACRVFRDPATSELADQLVENLRGEGNFENVREACERFTSGRRGRLGQRDPSPEEMIVISAMNLEDACQGILAALFSGDVNALPTIGPDTVRSRHSSEQVLLVLHAR